MSPAGHLHGRVIMRFAAPLHQYVREHGLGEVFAAETGFVVARNPDTVRAPDTAFVSSARLSAGADAKSYWPEAPDLALEVLSPGDVFSEVEEKISQWLEAGTRLVVILDPRRRRATAYRSLSEIVVLTEDDMLDCADVVPGFSIPLRTVFE